MISDSKQYDYRYKKQYDSIAYQYDVAKKSLIINNNIISSSITH